MMAALAIIFIHFALLPQIINCDELKSVARFKGASLTGSLQLEKNCLLKDTSGSGTIMKVMARGSAECGKVCILTTDCTAANFHKSHQECILLKANGVSQESATGWHCLKSKKTNIYKGIAVFIIIKHQMLIAISKHVKKLVIFDIFSSTN